MLGLSEDAAHFRITAARAARRFPVILELLADGGITLTAVKLLAPHFTEDNHRELLDAVRRKSKRVVEEMVARLQPRPGVTSLVRKVPEPKIVANAEPAQATTSVRAQAIANDATTTGVPPADVLTTPVLGLVAQNRNASSTPAHRTLGPPS